MATIVTRSGKGSPLTWQEADNNFTNLNTFTQQGTGAVSRVLETKVQESVSVKDFGAVGDGVTDDTVEIQAAIDAMYSAGGGVVLFSSGTYITSATLIIKSKVLLRGAGRGITTIKLATGSNCDMIKSTGFGTFASLADAGVPKDFGIEALTLNGNYLSEDWNSVTSVVNNSLGYGIKIEGYGFGLDVELYNIPEIGLFTQGEGSPIKSEEIYSEVQVSGRVFGKEGIVWKGPGDCSLSHAWIGLAGILPFSSGTTTFATSTYYTGDPVDGIVIDSTTIEIGTIHVYASWSGVGFRTRGTVRIEGDHLISESNNGQVWLSSGTYGSLSNVSLRNLSLYHPSWSASAPSYTAPNPRWDGITCEASSFNIGTLKIYRSVTGIKRVPATIGLVLSGSGCSINMTYRNTSPTDAGDSEYGGRYSGSPLIVSGSNNCVSITSVNQRGSGISITGDSNIIDSSVSSPLGWGTRCSGTINVLRAICTGHTQELGVGAAFSNDGSNNNWTTCGSANAVPFVSATGLGRVGGINIYGATRAFTIATGAITVTTFDDRITVDTEAAAATDDLDTITGGAIFQRLTIAASNSARDVVIKDGVGNIRLAGDFTLTHAQDRIVLEYDGSSWIEISRSDNSA